MVPTNFEAFRGRLKDRWPRPRAVGVGTITIVLLLVLLPRSADAAESPFESGSVVITDDWTTVAITAAFVDPVVVAGPASEVDTEPGVVEVANVSAASFDIRFREWAYLDGGHAEETAHYLIVERGTTDLASGGRIEAGTTSLGNSYTRVQFGAAFSGGAPAVFSTVLDNVGEPVAPRVKALTATRIDFRQWVEEGAAPQPAVPANWVAWSKGSGSADEDGVDWDTGTISVDERSGRFVFPRSYSTPCVLADISTSTSNPVTVRSSNPTVDSIDLRAVEEQANDNEVGLQSERLSTIVLDCGMGSGTPDATPPVWGNDPLVVSNVGSASFDLSWTAASDNVGVQGYRVFVDGAFHAAVVGTSVTVADLAPGTEYTVSVEAYDAANNTAAGPSADVITADPPAGSATIVTGLTVVTDEWAVVDLPEAFADPVVVAGPASETHPDPGVVVIGNVTSTSFQLRFREWDYLDGDHGPETVAWMVVERGVTVLPSGSRVEAGTTSMSSSLSTVSFAGSFGSRPSLITTVASDNGTTTVSPRIRSLNGTSFRHRFFVEEGGSLSRPAEDLNWVAWQTGSHDGGSDGFAWETASRSVDENARQVGFGRIYQEPCVFAEAYQNLANPATIRFSDRTASHVYLRLSEDQAQDAETALANEPVVVLVAECQIVDIDPPEPDTSAPVFGAGSLIGSEITSSSLRLTWPAATDNVGVAGYRVLQDGAPTPVFDGPGLTMLLDGLPPSTSFDFVVEAYDEAGNISTQLAATVVTAAESGDSLPATGLVQITGEWTVVDLPHAFSDPVVVAGPASESDPDPGVVIVRNLTPTSFEIRFREWDYLDGVHGTEEVAWIAAERGVTVLPSGSRVEAGTVSSGDTFSGNVTFDSSFGSRPAFAATMASSFGANSVAPRIRNLTATRFQHSTIAEEGGPSSWPAEDMNWLAWQFGSDDGTNDGFAWETFRVTADEAYRAISFTESYGLACVAAETNTLPPDPSTIRHRNLSTDGVELRIAEEQSSDAETALGNETLNILVVECGDGPEPDETPPEWGPASLTSTDKTSSSITVDFSPGALDPALAGYRLLVDGQVVATRSPSATTAVALGLSPSTSYSLSVEAFDTFGNNATLGPIAVTTEAGSSQTLHVEEGSSGDGSEASPFGTIQDALANVQPGQTILVRDGTYEGTFVTTGGAENAPVTIAAAVGHAPLLTNGPFAHAAIEISGAGYVTVAGFEMDGTGGSEHNSGVAITSSAHSIRIVGNHIHDFPASGIEIVEAAGVELLGNRVHGNSRQSFYQTSGISIFRPIGSDNPGFDNVIADNIVYDNYNVVPNMAGQVTDGNCIIIDNGDHHGYQGEFLIQNNVCVDNGGRGIHVFKSSNAFVVNNTLYRNLTHPEIDDGELTANEANDVTFRNNLVWSNVGTTDFHLWMATNVTSDNNIFVGQVIDQSGGANSSIADAMLQNPNVTPGVDDFRPLAGSSVVGAGSSIGAPMLDLRGVVRGSPPTVGALEP